MSPVDAYQHSLTRRQVAERLGVSISAVRHMERRSELHPTQVDGVWLFAGEEVERLAASREESAPGDPDAAVVFGDFEEGRDVSWVVRERGLLPAKARKLKAAWLDEGELTARTLEYLDEGKSIEWIARRLQQPIPAIAEIYTARQTAQALEKAAQAPAEAPRSAVSKAPPAGVVPPPTAQEAQAIEATVMQLARQTAAATGGLYTEAQMQPVMRRVVERMAARVQRGASPAEVEKVMREAMEAEFEALTAEQSAGGQGDP